MYSKIDLKKVRQACMGFNRVRKLLNMSLLTVCVEWTPMVTIRDELRLMVTKYLAEVIL